MKSNLKFFKKKKLLPVDEFFFNVLYDKKIGYYTAKNPFGKKGDFVTAPNISNLFSEMIAIWIISTWEIFGKPKKINIVELGPGDGGLMKVLVNVFKNFPEFNAAKKIYLFEISGYLKKVQKENIKYDQIKWVNNFKKIKKGPVIFFGNEFFDAMPIKQFIKSKSFLFEKYVTLEKNYKIKEIFKKASAKNIENVKSYKTLKNQKFIEFPKLGFKKLQQIIKKISSLNGCLLMIDYGYQKPNNQNTMQSVMGHKKNNIFKNLGKADVTSHVNFNLLQEFFLKNNLNVKKTISQEKFLKNMGIVERAEIIAKKMKFSDQTNLYLRLKRLLSPKLMGNLFKVILAYKFKDKNYFGFK